MNNKEKIKPRLPRDYDVVNMVLYTYPGPHKNKKKEDNKKKARQVIDQNEK